MSHPLRPLLDRAADGVFPPVDGDVVVVPPDGSTSAIVEFTGHAVVLTDVDRDELLALGADGFGGVIDPRVVLAVAGDDAQIGCHDAVLATRGRSDGADLASGPLDVRHDLDNHPRVVRSRAHRRDVLVLGDGRGLVTLGSGLVGRREISVELFDETASGSAAGRELLDAALHHVPSSENVWAQVSPGNAASLRAFLSVGFTPIGAETLIVRRG